jgi:hypothetical protein
MTFMKKFGAFWYDFLVGDRMELFIGPVVALMVAWGLLRMGLSSLVVGLFLFAAVCFVGGLSLALIARGGDGAGN